MKTLPWVGGIALLGTAAVEMVAGAIQAVTEPASPAFIGGPVGRLPVQIPRLALSASDRLSVFARTGANLTVALVLVAAVVVVATWPNRDHRAEDPSGLAPPLLLVTAILASVVILVNAAMCVEVMRNATGLLSGGPTNRAAIFFEFLAPIGVSIGVLWCAGTRPESRVGPRALSQSSVH